MTNLSVATASNPSHLPARYEIRRLTENEVPWAVAVMIHSNLFYSPVWPVIYPDGLVARSYAAFKAGDYLARHQVESGQSFGIFDLEYQYRTEEAKKAGGKLFWDLDDTNVTKEKLLEQMDFPLVSHALSYDGIDALDMARLGPLMEVLPAFGDVYHRLEELDQRKPESWKPTGPKQVLLRNSTSTRREYEGEGLMRKLAEWLMRHADEEGFRGVQIECLADQVIKVWSGPPAPYKATVVSEFNTNEYSKEEEVDGVKKEVFPFGKAKQRCTKIYVGLKPGAHANGTANGTANGAV